MIKGRLEATDATSLVVKIYTSNQKVLTKIFKILKHKSQLISVSLLDKKLFSESNYLFNPLTTHPFTHYRIEKDSVFVLDRAVFVIIEHNIIETFLDIIPLNAEKVSIYSLSWNTFNLGLFDLRRIASTLTDLVIQMDCYIDRILYANVIELLDHLEYLVIKTSKSASSAKYPETLKFLEDKQNPSDGYSR
jgi:hypothetical protein